MEDSKVSNSEFIRSGFFGLLRMRRLLFLASVLLGAVFAPVNGQAAERLLESDIQLIGERSVKAISIFVNSAQAQPVQLKLDFRSSALIHPRRSTVNVKLNGQTRSTRRFSDIAEQTFQLSLRPLKPGRHELSIEVFLRADDDCMPTPEGLWVTLQDSSTIAGAVVATSASTAPKPLPAVKDFPAAWTREMPPGTASLTQADKAVQLSHDFLWDQKMAAAMLQAQVFLANRSYSVSLVPGLSAVESEAGVKPTLILRHADRLPKEHPLATRWQQGKDLHYILRVIGPQGLEITARSPEGINLAFDMLGYDEHRNLCVQSTCSLTMTHADLQKRADPQPVLRPESLLWSMSEGDQPRGWTAKGIGIHKLRQVWVRPVGRVLKSDVSLELVARASQAQSIDLQQSSISVRINDALLATYSLADWKQARSKLPIPRSLWSSAAWVMDFDVRLVQREMQRCSYLAQDDIWVAFDPSTKLVGGVKAEEDASIAGFWHRASGRSALALNWQRADSTVPEPEMIARIVPLLQSLTENSAAPSASRWLFVPAAACAELPCISIHAHSTAHAAVPTVTLPWRELLAKSPEVARRLPDLNAANAAIMAWVARSGSTPEQLHIAIGASQSGESISVAPLSSFFGTFATHAERWSFFRDPASIGNPSDAQELAGEGNQSLQQSKLRWINLLWALSSIVIVGLVAARLWRQKRKPDPKSWEIQ
jgi:hypothetical protein